MKTLNCEQVFEVLTRGPFPTGEAIDAPVERHLATCHDCRALAEALRPALELFHEAIEPEESRDLPGYHGSLSPSTGGLAQLVAAAIDAESSPAMRATQARPSLWNRLRAHRPSQFEAFLAAMAVGALFVFSLAGFGATETPVPPQAAAFSPGPDGMARLAALELRPACFSWTPADGAAALHCCTECHTASSKTRLPERSLAVVTASCVACHP